MLCLRSQATLCCVEMWFLGVEYLKLTISSTLKGIPHLEHKSTMNKVVIDDFNMVAQLKMKLFPNLCRRNAAAKWRNTESSYSSVIFRYCLITCHLSLPYGRSRSSVVWVVGCVVARYTVRTHTRTHKNHVCTELLCIVRTLSAQQCNPSPHIIAIVRTSPEILSKRIFIHKSCGCLLFQTSCYQVSSLEITGKSDFPRHIK